MTEATLNVSKKINQQLNSLGGPSIITVVNDIVEHAYLVRASDIHIDPTREHLRVRLRVDGVLTEVHQLPKSVHNEVISRIKILAGLRTDEHQAAQDGRFRITVSDNAHIDIRVSIAPTHYGENAVLRLLCDNAEDYNLTSLGFSESNAQKISSAMRRSYGMILATGPTGSGKTTTLYTLLKQLNTPDVSVITIEDPIEYAVEGIEQIQVNPRTGLTFATGLRSILRQDPNIIMVGEIRDQETAGIAVNSALTGHLILSTLHTNDAATTLPRLLDMNVESYLISSTVNVAIGQRLVRKICENCKTVRKLSDVEMKSLKEVMGEVNKKDLGQFYVGKGCEACNQTGFRGRIGIHEVLVPDEEIREAVLKKMPASEIKRIAIEHGMTTLVQDGLEKAGRGLTTIEEVLRTLYE